MRPPDAFTKRMNSRAENAGIRIAVSIRLDGVVDARRRIPKIIVEPLSALIKVETVLVPSIGKDLSSGCQHHVNGRKRPVHNRRPCTVNVSIVTQDDTSRHEKKTELQQERHHDLHSTSCRGCDAVKSEL
jgi:hypothetical protein